MRTHTLPLVLATWALVGCTASAGGGSAFSPSYPDNRPGDVQAALAAARPSAPSGEQDLVAALSADGTHLLGIDTTDGAVRYRVEASSTIPTLVAGRYVFVEQGSALRILDLTSGRELTRVDLGTGLDAYHVVGAHADGGLAAVGLTRGEGPGARSRLLVVRGGSVDREVALDRSIGAPAVVGERLFVPWGYQFLSMLDARGRETARVRLRTGVISHALADAGQVWFGGASLFRLGADTATETPSGYTPPTLGVERAPTLLPTTYEIPPPLTSAAYHVRLVFGVDATDAGARPADGTLYLVYYRFVFALSAEDGHPLWVRDLPSDVVGATAFVGGMQAACETGELITLAAADGRIVASHEVGERLAHVAFPRRGRVTLPESSEAPRPAVREQLVAAVQVPDARLVTAREYALERIAAIPDDDATSDLGLLCEDARLPQRTRRKACDFLAARPTGEPYVLSQLARHGSFLDERPHPPVGALARAAASMRSAEAVPLLVEQLEDPRTPVSAIAPLAEALVALDARSAAPALLTFLRTYHVEATEEGMAAALTAVAYAYGRLGGDDATATVRSLAAEPLVPSAVARGLRDAADRVRTERRNATAQPAADVVPVAPTVAPTPTMPTHITHEMAEPVLAPVRPGLTACLDQDAARPGSARVIVVLTRAGTVSSVHTTPASVEPCMRDLLLPVAFPATHGNGPTRLTFTVSRYGTR